MRITILTQYYPPETGAPQNRLSDLARRLVRMGHEVTVLTAMPNYPRGMIQPAYRGKLWHRETMDGVVVLRSWIFATKSRAIIPWLTHYFTFVITSFFSGLFRLGRTDVLVLESPPIFLGFTGYALAKLKGAKFVLNVADLWPKVGIELGIIRKRYQVVLMQMLEKFLYRHASLITGQTKGIVEHVQAIAPKTPVRLLTNGTDLDFVNAGAKNGDARKHYDLNGGSYVVGFAGLHGPAQALHTLIGAAELLRDQPEITIALFGDGPVKPELERRVAEKNLQNVRFFVPQPRENMPDVFATFDAAAVTLFNSPISVGWLPAKMFEVMGAAKPVVLSAPEGEASAIVKAANGGIVVNPESPEQVADALRRLYQDRALGKELGENARAYVLQYHNRATIAENFAGWLSEISPAKA